MLLVVPTLNFIQENPFPMIFCSIFIYLIFRFYIFKRSLHTLYGPLHIGLIFLSCSCSLIVLPLYDQGSNIYTYFIVLFFLFLFLIISSRFSIQTSSNLNLRISDRLQLFLSISVLCVILLHLALNVLSGPILLFDPNYGSNARYLLWRNNRLILWSFYGVLSIPTILFSLSSKRKIKIINLLSISLTILISLLSAAKSSFFSVFFLFYQYVFLKSLTQNTVNFRLLRIVNLLLCASLFVFPLFIIFIKLTDDPFDSIGLIAVRLVGGFDQLIFWINSKALPEAQGISLLDIYFAPVLKMIFGYIPKFNTAVELLYSNYLYYSDVSEGSLPNSNLIIELIFSCGLPLSIFAFSLLIYFNFRLRKYLLELTELKYYHLPLFQAFVLSPLNLLIDDQSFIVTLYFSIFMFIAFHCLFKSILFALSLLYPLGLIRKI
jgi:hypothetical protein